MSRARIQEAIRTRVEIAGRIVRPATELSEGDEVIVTWPAPAAPSGAVPPIAVLHEDPDLLVVDKPAGLLAHATASSKGFTLLGALEAVGRTGLGLVHRLDRETSGVLVLGRTPEAARALSKAFAAGRARKTYLAVVFGRLGRDEGLIDLPLGAARGSAIHIKQGVDRESGRPARTRFRVRERLDGFTFLELRPETGRRHQIRVHLREAGHPVVGDKLYGPREAHHLRFLAGGLDERMRRELLADRQLLHAWRLEIPHPRGGICAFEAPVPADMLEFIESRRRPPA